MAKNTMTVGDLIEALEEFDPDSPVALAMQPSWPFEYTIGQIIAVRVDDNEDELETVYLVEEEQTRYLPAEASEALGWK